jgi:membrane protein YqaA with SNARE-associated domain
MNIEQLGLVGIFLAGAIPWMEAAAVVPGGIILGLDPTATVIAATVGNALTIFLFAYLGSNIRIWVMKRRVAKGKTAESPKYEKALKAFDKYGIYGMAFLGPVIIGTQFAAAASVAAGVKPLRTSIIISTAMVIWAVAIASIVVVFDLDLALL